MSIQKPTIDQVRAIVQTALDDTQLGTVIDDAALMVARCVAGLDGDLQAAIVKYVTAHLLASSGRGGESSTLTSRKLGDAQKSWSRAQVGQSLAGTAFGQQALMLDPTDCLQTLGTKLARVVVL